MKNSVDQKEFAAILGPLFEQQASQIQNQLLQVFNDQIRHLETNLELRQSALKKDLISKIDMLVNDFNSMKNDLDEIKKEGSFLAAEVRDLKEEAALSLMARNTYTNARHLPLIDRHGYDNLEGSMGFLGPSVIDHYSRFSSRLEITKS